MLRRLGQPCVTNKLARCVPLRKFSAKTLSEEYGIRGMVDPIAAVGVPPIPELRPVAFENGRRLSHRSFFWLVRAFVVLRLCRVSFIAKNSLQLLRSFERYFGSYITYEMLVRLTIYKQFCGGENEGELHKTVDELTKQGIGCVLDYAAEFDEDAFDDTVVCPPQRSLMDLITNRTLPYKLDGAFLDKNQKLAVISIVHASLHLPADGIGFAGIKVTAICNPQLLCRLSAILHVVNRTWVEFTGRTPPNLENCRDIDPELKQLALPNHELRRKLSLTPERRHFTDHQLDQIMSLLDPYKRRSVNYLTYQRTVFEALTAHHPTSQQQLLCEGLPTLTVDEKHFWSKMRGRLTCLVEIAEKLNVRILMDAEQSFFQTATNALVQSLQRDHNRTFPVVYNTYQCYLKNAESILDDDFRRAEEEGWVWGGKMVRGAYMELEREISEKHHYDCPIHATYSDTNHCFDALAKRILHEINANDEKRHEVFFGTHNKSSLELISSQILDNPAKNSQVRFGQLYGMADELTMPLVQAGFGAMKYLPYGPVKETIQYLSRRIMENSGMLTSNERDEVAMIRKEIVKRLFRL